MSNKKFNQEEYIREYKKKNYKTFSANLRHEEFDKFNNLLNEWNVSKPEFLRIIFNYLEKNNKNPKKL